MWSYYGSKGKLIKYYPKPIHDKIIEPYAGAAKYSMEYFYKDVTLVDKYEKVTAIWQYLQKCSRNDILRMPDVKPGLIINEQMFDCIEAFWLMGFMIVGGGFMPNRTVSPWGAVKYPGIRRKIANNLFKIQHWKIINASYETIPNQKATWFIDPPYEFGGHKYPMGNKNLDFNAISNWCKEREGQVIVCENTKATWMDFKPIISQRGLIKKTTEAIWTNEPTVYHNEQTILSL